MKKNKQRISFLLVILILITTFFNQDVSLANLDDLDLDINEKYDENLSGYHMDSQDKSSLSDVIENKSESNENENNTIKGDDLEQEGTFIEEEIKQEETIKEETTKEETTKEETIKEEIKKEANKSTIENDEKDYIESKEDILSKKDFKNKKIKKILYDDNVKTEISFSGFMPENVSIDINPVTIEAEDKSLEVLLAYDISLYDKESNLYEPIEGHPITVEIKNENIKEDEDIYILHMEDKKSEQEILEYREKESGVVTFEAESFSIYSVTKKYTHSYSFTVDGEVVSGSNGKQIIKDEEKIFEPSTPDKKKHKFIGWEVFDGDKSLGLLKFKDGLAEPIISIEENKEFEAKAKFHPILYIYFMDSLSDDARVFTTKEALSGDKVDVNDVKLPLASNESVVAWYTDKELEGESIKEDFQMGNENIYLWPDIQEGNYIKFDTGDGGSYQESIFISALEKTIKPSKEPVRPGYDFSHWSDIKDGSEYEFGKTIDEDITLHAVWKAKEVNYKIVYWKQSVNDDKKARDSEKTYDYDGFEIRSAKTNNTVIISDRYVNNKNYPGFKYARKDKDSLLVKGDGTSIVNVYYDRELLTISFDKNNIKDAENQTFTGLYGQTLAQNGYEWPSDYRWTYGKWSTSETLTFLDTFKFDDLGIGKDTEFKLYANYQTGESKINHYKQNIDGSYELANSSKVNRSSIFNYIDFKLTNKYNGFTVSSYKSDRGLYEDASVGSSARFKNLLEVRHDRNNYKLTFLNNTEYEDRNILYERSLKNENHTPKRPKGIPDAYEFKGWYKDDSYTEKFNFEKETMPANNLILYAKWEAPEIKTTFHFNDGSGQKIVHKLKYGEKLDRKLVPTVKYPSGNIVFEGSDKVITIPENHKWAGWSVKNSDGSYSLYNFDNLIFEDIDLYPYWINNSAYTVTYEYMESKYIDPIQYAENSYGELEGKDVISLDDNLKNLFVGWKVKDSEDKKIYYPGDKILIKGDIVLEPVFTEEKGKTKIIYDPGIVTGKQFIEENIIINDTILLEDNLFETPEGYSFLGWKIKNDGSKEIYEAGSKFIVDEVEEEKENVFVAIWSKEIKVEKEWDGPEYEGDINFKLLRDGQEFSDKDSYRLIGKDEKEKQTSLDSSVKILEQGKKNLVWTVDAQIDGEYRVEEEVPSGYEASYSFNDKDGSLKVRNSIKKIPVSISNQVTGNMADKNLAFNYSYKIYKGDQIIKEEEFSLKDSEKKEEIDLPYGYTIKVEQDELVGYTSSVNDEKDLTFTFTYDDLSTENIGVRFENEKSLDIPTGIKNQEKPMFILITLTLFIAITYVIKSLNKQREIRG